MSQKITISISNEDKDYLVNDKLLSPSKIFQIALHNIKENRENLKERIRQLELLLKKYTDFVFSDVSIQDMFNKYNKNVLEEERKSN